MKIIKSLSKIKNKNEYKVIIDDKEYIFDEDTILEYRLFKDKEIDDNTLNLAKRDSELSKYYNQAVNYAYRYGKNHNEVFYYLIDKGLDNDSANNIVDKIKSKKLINEAELINSYIYSYAKAYNGKKMIEEKLKNKKFDKELIADAIKSMDYDLYYEALAKLYEKIKHKYDKYDDYIKRQKIKQYLYQRGYDSSDISTLDI